MFTGEWYIFGAKSTAIGMIRAIREIDRECIIKGVIVSSANGNPELIEGYKVETLSELSKRFTAEEKKLSQILIATPIYVQQEIKEALSMFGFSNCKMLDSKTEALYMSEYYKRIGLFPSLTDLDVKNESEMPRTCVLEVMHCNDQILNAVYPKSSWVFGFQAGLDAVPNNILNKIKYRDSDGENIAERNALYWELTAQYWAWKNLSEDNLDYVGTIQYRRYLDVDDNALKACKDNNVDVILPYPMIHMPNIKEHHSRYANEPEWEALLQAVSELAPEYYSDYERIFSSQYMYNYNMLIAKKDVFDDYCAWLFPILERTEEICREKDIILEKRSLAYFGESMLTLYFMHNAGNMKVMHVGRMLLS